MLIQSLNSRNSYKAVNDILNDVVLHDIQGLDVLRMIAIKRAMVIYDTGTGKTLLAAAAMKLLIREDPSRMFVMFVKKDQLVQTPKKLKDFAGLSSIVTTADAKVSANYFLKQNLADYNVIMLTHDCLHKESILEAIYKIKHLICGIIIDEAHEYNNFNNAQSANVLKAIVSRFEYVWGLTATPIVSDLKQLARLANLIDSTRYPDPSKLCRNLENGRFSITYDKEFFINRSAVELGRASSPTGYVVSVPAQASQYAKNLGGVALFQNCKGYGAVNQVTALIELIRERKYKNERGLVYISQGSILSWVAQNLDKSDLTYAIINGDTPLSERSIIEKQFASNDYDVILTSITTAVDLDCEYVVFYEFTVMVSQMIGRAHRGLNSKELKVYFIITKDTNEIDYFMNNVFAKCQIVRDILGKGNSAVEEAACKLGVHD